MSDTANGINPAKRRAMQDASKPFGSEPNARRIINIASLKTLGFPDTLIEFRVRNPVSRATFLLRFMGGENGIPQRTKKKRIWLPRVDDFRTFLADFVPKLPQLEPTLGNLGPR